jgi:hypothetical protein
MINLHARRLLYSAYILLLLESAAHATFQPQPLREIGVFANKAVVNKEDKPDFSGDGRSGQNSAGGSRGECPDVEGPPLTALIPDSNYGTTLQEQPTLWLYVPYTPEQVVRGEFSLQDGNGEDISDRLRFSLPQNAPGFVSVTLPESFRLHEIDTEYRWYFELYCIADGSPVSVYGWIQRSIPSNQLLTDLNSAEFPEYMAFTNHQIWFDVIDALATLHMDTPESPAPSEHWNSLLSAKGVSLGNLPDFVYAGEIILSDGTNDR